MKKQSAPKKGFNREEKASSKVLFRILAFFLLLFCIFTLAAMYSNWTGEIGQKLSELIFSRAGGAFVIICIYVIYLSISGIFSRRVPSLFRQTLATLLLYLLSSLILGINRLTSNMPDNYVECLAPGKTGDFLCEKLYVYTGALGTFLIGAVVFYVMLILYRIPINSMILALFARLRSSEKSKKDEKARKIEKIKARKEEKEESEANSPEDDFILNSGQTATASDIEDEEAPVAEKRSWLAKETETEIAENPAISPAKAPTEKKAPTKETKSSPEKETENQDPKFNLSDGPATAKANIFPPPIEIFGPEENHDGEMNQEKSMPLGEKIIRALEQFNIEAKLAEILVGPTVIQFRIQLAPGIKVSKVAALSNDIALALAVPSLRIEAPIPGKPYVGIEIPNPNRRGIPLRTVVEDPAFKHTKAALPLPYGITVSGDAMVVGLEELPHLLVAGTTGSGKSVFINSCIVGLCSVKTPDELKMILVDPKRVEMAIYEKLPHLLTAPVTDAKKAVHTLAWAIREMEERYTIFAKARVRNLEGYNNKVLPKDKLPHIVIVVDELADLMMTAAKEVEEYICRLAQMARATGIHLVLATQRPSVNVITGLIKANIPARVAFTLPSNADSRTIIDCAGAEKLLGKGDMLFMSTKYPKPIRIQAPWIDEDVLAGWLEYIVNIFGEPEFIDIDKQAGGQSGSNGDTIYDDELLEDAIDTVLSTGIASASGLQRRLRVGFSRASRLIDMMEQLGIVGPADGSRPRNILVDEETAHELLENAREE